MIKIGRKGKIGITVTITVVAILGTLIGISSVTFADSNVQSTILKKAAYYQLFNCYKNNLETSVSLSSYRGAGSLFSGDTKYPLPSGFTGVDSGDTGGDKITCKQLIDGASGFDGLAKYAKDYGQTKPDTIPPADKSNKTAVDQFMEGMGYTKSTHSDSNTCAMYAWNVTYAGTDASYYQPKTIWVKMCAPELNNGRIASDRLTVTYGSSNENETAKPEMIRIDPIDHKIQLYCNYSTIHSAYGGCTDHSFNSDTKWSDFTQEVLADITRHASSRKRSVRPGVEATYQINLDDTSNDETNYNISDWSLGASAAMRYLSNGNYTSILSGSSNTVSLNTEEKMVLTQKLLENYYGISQGSYNENGGLVCDPSDSQLTAVNSWGYKKTGFYIDGRLNKNCYAKPTKHSGSQVYYYNSRGIFDGVTKKGFDDLIGVMNNSPLNTLSDAGAMTTNPGDAGNNDGDEDIQSPCTLAGGPLSWILCPALSVIGETVQTLYDWIEDQFLDVDVGFYSTESDTYGAWKKFQTYANIFFIILLVFVILSQVTGFGISNYGIKKTLPKLILAIILINISFFVCQIAVDLSNIVGNTIRKTFDDITGDLAAPSTWGSTVGSIVSYFAGTAELTGIAVGAGIMITLNPDVFASWMPMIILTLIGVVIGVIFFFIILCVRQAAVIVLIMLSPLAVAAYSLPNTKKLFDRWFKLFTALLLVYPICGLLMGGGNFVSSTLISSAADGDGGLGMILVGLLANIVPFFLIPSILRSSMAGLGNLGAKITGFGDRMNRRLGRAALSSEGFKERQRQALKNRNQARFERLNEGRGVRQRLARGLRRVGATGSADSLERASRRDLARSWSAYSRAQNEDNEMEDMAENINPNSIEARRATRRAEIVDQRINDLANLMTHSDVYYTNDTGASVKINVNDPDELEKAHKHYLRQAESATDTATKQEMIEHAQSVQQIMFNKGDKTRSKAMKNLFDHTLGDGTSANPGYGKDSDVTQSMFSRIVADDKAMAKLKTEDPGSFELAGAVMGNKPLQNRQHYELPEAKNFTVSSIKDMSDNTVENLMKQDASGKYNFEHMEPEQIHALSDVFTRAITDPIASQQLKGKPDQLKMMNAVREKSHELAKDDYLRAGGTEAQFEAEYGKFQKLSVGESFKVPHAKAAMPGDWRRNPGDRNRWYEYKGGVAKRALNLEEIKKANLIETQNMQADIQNELEQK